MDLLSLCHYCPKPARYSCTMCGRPVCSEHIERQTLLCQQCALVMRKSRGHEPPIEDYLLH